MDAKCFSVDWYGMLCLFFFFNDTATTEIYTLSLHDALPISVNSNPENAEAFKKAEEAIHQEIQLEMKALQDDLQALRKSTEAKLSFLDGKVQKVKPDKDAQVTKSGVQTM